MQRTIVITCLAAATAASVVVAQQELPAEQRAKLAAEVQQLTQAVELRARAGALETRVTRGQPYSADAVTEFVQSLPDGNRIVRRTTVRLARDSEGRTRRETLSDGSGEATSIVITDSVAGLSFALNPEKKTVTKSPAMFAKVAAGGFAGGGGRGGAGERAVVTVRRISPIEEKVEAEKRAALVAGNVAEVSTAFAVMGRAMARRQEIAKEPLGQQLIEGVMATGTKTTTTIPAGAVGNELPIAIVSEQWSSPELDVLVLTRHNDPRSGETTYKLINLVRAEPDRSLFQVPADYAVSEPRKPPFEWQFRHQE